MHTLGRTNAHRDNKNYKALRATALRLDNPTTRKGMGRLTPTRLPRLNGIRGGYGR